MNEPLQLALAIGFKDMDEMASFNIGNPCSLAEVLRRQLGLTPSRRHITIEGAQRHLLMLLAGCAQYT